AAGVAVGVAGPAAGGTLEVVSDGEAPTGPVCAVPVDPVAPFPPPTWTVPVEPVAWFPPPPPPTEVGMVSTASPNGEFTTLADGPAETGADCAVNADPDDVLPPPTCTVAIESVAVF